MSEKNDKKYLLSLIYKTIFKEIYPVDVGNAAHAAKINNYSKQRKEKGYQYDEYHYLKLHIDDAIDLSGFDFEINEGNFHNWMNGISSPKYLVTINSILEYLIDTCNDKGKYDLLKSRILTILKSNEFNAYIGDLIRDTVKLWILKIENDDRETLLRTTKELLYLLKNKDKFAPYLLKESHELKEALHLENKEKPVEVITGNDEVNIDEVVVDAEIESPNTYNLPQVEKRIPNKYNKYKFIAVAAALLILLPLTYIINNSNHQPNKLDKSNKTVSVLSASNITKSPDLLSSNNDNVSKKDVGENNNETTSQESLLSASVNNVGTSAAVEITPAPQDEVLSTTMNNAVSNTSAEATIPPKKENVSSVSSKTLSNLSTTAVEITSSPQKKSLSSSSGNSLDNLVPPEITIPRNGITLPLSDLTVQWEPADSVDSYMVVVTDTNSWTKIFTKTDIVDTSIVLDKSIFKVGGSYRIYLQSMIGKEESAPNYIDVSIEPLSPPEIIAPANAVMLPISDLKVQWEPVDFATSYVISVTDTNDWTKTFSKTDISDNSIVLEKSLFKPGGNYRIYVHSAVDQVYSEPNYIDISIEKLLPPEITNPVNGTQLDVSDIKVEWKAANLATSYVVAVTDLNTWTKIFTQTDITENSILLDQSLFKSGGDYRVYLLSEFDKEYSEANYIDIHMKDLSSN